MDLVVVADTSFLIDVLTGDVKAKAKLEEFVTRQEPVWIPSPALHELYYGARLHRRHEQELRRIEGLERAVPPLAFDAAAARRGGILEARLELVGKRPSRADVQIAAIALVRGESVVSRDRAFASFDDLEVERY